MKANIEYTILFLSNILSRLFNFMILMFIVAFVSCLLISLINENVTSIIFLINLFIAFTPILIDILLLTILGLIDLIIYGED